MNSRIFMSLYILVVSFVFALGCAKTHDTGKTEPKGFISDVSMLEEDPEGKVTLVYINENVDFASYDKVWLETITIYVFEGSKLADMPVEKLNKLIAYMRVALERELGKNNQIVDEAGPGVIQFRFALTEVSGSNVLLDTVTTVYPPARAFSELKRFVTGKHTAVGQAAFEAEALDAETGERLAAAMGVRAGGKTLKTDFSKYRDVEAAVDTWAVTVSERFERLKQKSAGAGQS
ncbi:MAG: DUF3313 domain-containing protein [Deltaproteobacteria bacterium]|nr:DUF3313 domain-containing protein [Deltaproteobacteria bacterium]MCK5709709.1 DUF3313 domain-containing protein [Deltaproteobacteria bacterium]